MLNDICTLLCRNLIIIDKLIFEFHLNIKTKQTNRKNKLKYMCNKNC